MRKSLQQMPPWTVFTFCNKYLGLHLEHFTENSDINENLIDELMAGETMYNKVTVLI